MNMLNKILSAHKALWNEEILHRDICIKNVMLCPSENLKEDERSQGLLIDFDYASVAECGSDDDCESVQTDFEDRAVLSHRKVRLAGF